MTDAERKLWGNIRNDQLGVRFYRQKPIERFIVDFYCASARLVIEVDGSQHMNEQLEYDRERDAILRGLGLTVLRFDNRSVLTNIDGVMERIWQQVEESNKSCGERQ